MSSSEDNSSFIISQTASDDKFKSRTTSIFGCLDSLEKKHQETATTFHVEKDEGDKEEEVKDSSKLFKRPEQQLWRGGQNKRRLPRKVPDHVVNPAKWTKYSLKEDGSQDISTGRSAEQVNKKIALDFIHDLKERKDDTEEIDNDTLLDDKVTFKKPAAKTKESLSEDTASLFGSAHGSKARVMETFHFGKKQTKPQEKPKTDIIKSKIDDKIDVTFELNENEEKDLIDKSGDSNKNMENKTQDDSNDNDVNSKQDILIRKRKHNNRVIRKRLEDVEDD